MGTFLGSWVDGGQGRLSEVSECRGAAAAAGAGGAVLVRRGRRGACSPPPPSARRPPGRPPRPVCCALFVLCCELRACPTSRPSVAGAAGRAPGGGRGGGRRGGGRAGRTDTDTGAGAPLDDRRRRGAAAALSRTEPAGGAAGPSPLRVQGPGSCSPQSRGQDGGRVYRGAEAQVQGRVVCACSRASSCFCSRACARGAASARGLWTSVSWPCFCLRVCLSVRLPALPSPCVVRCAPVRWTDAAVSMSQALEHAANVLQRKLTSFEGRIRNVEGTVHQRACFCACACACMCARVCLCVCAGGWVRSI